MMNNNSTAMVVAADMAAVTALVGWTQVEVFNEDVAAEIEASATYQEAEVTAMNNEQIQATETTAIETPAATAPAAKAPKAKKAKEPKATYPFLTKAQISERIETDFSFACQVMVILHNRQTSFEQEVKTTKDKNRRGFMSSHAVNGSRVAEKIKRGEELTAEDADHVAAIAPRYTKQLAEHFRAEAIERDPSLREKAAAFFTSGGC